MNTTPPKLAYDLDHDVEVLVAMASSLTPYLYEDEMYGYLGGDMPRLTLGGLLLRLYRLSRLDDHLNADQQVQVQDAHINFDAERSKWAVHYENKLQRELLMRIKALERFLKECAEDPQPCAASYPAQSEKRTMIHHLYQAAEEQNVLLHDTHLRLYEVDGQLRRIFREGEFITDDRLKDIYPPGIFWWLYGYVPEQHR